MPKHSKGEWLILDKRKLKKLDPYESIAIATKKPDGKASIICRIENRVSKRPLNEEDEANARLIAASPKLFKFVKGLSARGYFDGEMMHLIDQIESQPN